MPSFRGIPNSIILTCITMYMYMYMYIFPSIHEGEVRSYEGKRTLEELQQYIESEEWKKMNPMPWWRSPTAKQLAI